MFTGIVKGKFPVTFLEKFPHLIRYGVELPSTLLHNLEIGASVSIDGVCQTVTAIKDNVVYFDAIKETLERTNFFQLKLCDYVNVERSLTVGSELGGHLLSGHIYTTAKILNIDETNGYDLLLEIDPQLIKYVIEKGYIALNGISLTIGKVYTNSFFIHLIPETLKITNIKDKKIGDLLNVEFDSQTQIIIHTIEQILPAYLNKLR